jgi:hypothetical protein
MKPDIFIGKTIQPGQNTIANATAIRMLIKTSNTVSL